MPHDQSEAGKAGPSEARNASQRLVAGPLHGPDLHAQGNIVDHEYTIERDGTKVAEVSKRWFRIRDRYGVEVAPGENDILILAIAAVIDCMAHPDR